jgi:reductive dehalogenase
MFSRNELVPGTKRFQAYYQRNPEKKMLDDAFRKNPGLLQKGTTQYHPFYFASADASFETIAALRDAVDGPVKPEQIPVEAEKMSCYIKNWSKKLGAVDCGITTLKDYHLYSAGGRAERYDKPITKQHAFAIAFTVEMDHEMVKSAPAGTMVMESAQQYLESGRIALQVAQLIRNLGYEARAHIDGNYQVVCPLVARDAGLGEIGRMGLLMTPKLGPRVRISVVTTNLPLVTDEPLHDYSVIDFCVQCKKCADVCPSRAISFADREMIGGALRWQINQESCFTFWTKAGTDCGRCISVCPYSHPDNALHNLVRTGIHHSAVFRTVALKMDDWIYGRRPAPAPVPAKLRN